MQTGIDLQASRVRKTIKKLVEWVMGNWSTGNTAISNFTEKLAYIRGSATFQEHNKRTLAKGSKSLHFIISKLLYS